jgi:hypothetical protein
VVGHLVRQNEVVNQTCLIAAIDYHGLRDIVITTNVVTNTSAIARDDAKDRAVFRHLDRKGVLAKVFFDTGEKKLRFAILNDGTLVKVTGKHSATSGSAIGGSCTQRVKS